MAFSMDDWAGDDYSAAGADAGAIDLWAGDTPTSGYDPGLLSSPAPAPTSNAVAVNSSSWLSGITNLGSAVVNIVRAVDPPKVGTQLINPQTGVPYGIDPATGKPVASAQASSLVTLVIFVILGIVAVKFIK